MANAPRPILALPSKGRILDEVRDLFAGARLTLESEGGGRDYGGRIKEHPELDVRFLPAMEIAAQLQAKKIDAGITGLDLLREQRGQGGKFCVIISWLNASRADVVVAVPQPSMQTADKILQFLCIAENMDELATIGRLINEKYDRPIRVATKYINLTEMFFRQFDFVNYKVIPSMGATEGTVLRGEADMIVDITSSGATLKQNQLRVLSDGVILRSEAVFAYCHPISDEIRDKLVGLHIKLNNATDS